MSGDVRWGPCRPAHINMGGRGVSLRVSQIVKVTADSLTGTLIPFIKLDFTFGNFHDF